MQAQIITIGDEILIGQILDTNSAYMAERLNSIGIRVGEMHSVSDSREAITNALEQAAARADLLLLTGGLGPTNDDITKQTLAEYTGARQWITHHETLENPANSHPPWLTSERQQPPPSIGSRHVRSAAKPSGNGPGHVVQSPWENYYFPAGRSI